MLCFEGEEFGLNRQRVKKCPQEPREKQIETTFVVSDGGDPLPLRQESAK